MPRFVSVGLILIGAFVCTEWLWFDIACGWERSPDGKMIETGAHGTLREMLWALHSWISDALPLGMVVLLVGSAGLAHRGWSGVRGSQWLKSPALGWTRAMWAATLAMHLLVLLFSAPFFFVPPGAAIRPMVYAYIIFCAEVVSMIVVLPLAIAAFSRESSHRAGVAGAVLALTPIFAALAISAIAQTVVGFTLAH